MPEQSNKLLFSSSDMCVKKEHKLTSSVYPLEFSIVNHPVDYNQTRLYLLPVHSSPSVDFLAGLQKFGINPFQMVQCPICKCKAELYRMIPHLNDSPNDAGIGGGFMNHGESFKYIGVWLKSLGY